MQGRSTRLKTLYDKSWSGSKHKEILSYYIPTSEITAVILDKDRETEMSPVGYG